MARRGLLGSIVTITAAAAAVAGVAYLFKDEIRSTKTYQDLDEKYDLDYKIKEYSKKAKEKAYDVKDLAKAKAKEAKEMAEKYRYPKDDFEDDIIFNGEDEESRDYISLSDAVEDPTDTIPDEDSVPADDAAPEEAASEESAPVNEPPAEDTPAEEAGNAENIEID